MHREFVFYTGAELGPGARGLCGGSGPKAEGSPTRGRESGLRAIGTGAQAEDQLRGAPHSQPIPWLPERIWLKPWVPACFWDGLGVESEARWGSELINLPLDRPGNRDWHGSKIPVEEKKREEDGTNQGRKGRRKGGEGLLAYAFGPLPVTLIERNVVSRSQLSWEGVAEEDGSWWLMVDWWWLMEVAVWEGDYEVERGRSAIDRLLAIDEEVKEGEGQPVGRTRGRKRRWAPGYRETEAWQVVSLQRKPGNTWEGSKYDPRKQVMASKGGDHALEGMGSREEDTDRAGVEGVGSGGRRSWNADYGDIIRAGGGCGGRFGGFDGFCWLGGGAHQGQSGWSKTTGATNL
ncbi:hypothetical protein BY996DRAFT_6475974 [Phakopsora pachyrhizi]|nr:hypothetical protein BY996DRAFT_6475974 [Phakopsora pachyrhizi]